jgi:hypothetical protein
MAIATLSRFTVPLASDQSASAQGMLMPKMKYRFRVMFENFGVSTPTTELTKQVAEAKRPTASFKDIPIEVYNSTFHLAGKGTWESMAIKLRDDVTGSVSKLVGEQMQKQFDFFEQASAAAGSDYKFTLRLEILDGGNGASTPTVLETWECYGCYITKVDYDTNNYATQEALTISLTIQPDNCLQTSGTIGVGVPVTRLNGTGTTGGGAR